MELIFYLVLVSQTAMTTIPGTFETMEECKVSAAQVEKDSDLKAVCVGVKWRTEDLP